MALAGGTAPDVAMLAVNTDLPAFAHLRALQPLDALARGAIDGFYPGFLRDCRVEGQLFALPFARSTPLLYLNGDVLRGAGLPDALPAGAPDTWPAFLDLCQRLVRARWPPRGPLLPRSRRLRGAGRALRHRPVAAGLRRVWRGHQLAGVPAAPVAFGGPTRMVEWRPGSPSPLRWTRSSSPTWCTAIGVAIATRAAQSEFVAGRIALLTVSSASLSQIEAEAPFRVLARLCRCTASGASRAAEPA